MRKIAITILIFLLSLSLIGCGDKKASAISLMVGGEKIYLENPEAFYYTAEGKPGKPQALTLEQILKLEHLLKQQTFVRIDRVYSEKPAGGSILIKGQGKKSQGFCFYAQIWQETPSAPQFVYIKPLRKLAGGEGSFQVHGNTELVAQIKAILSSDKT